MDRIIKNMRPFSELSADSLQVLLPYFVKTAFDKGAELIQEGKACQSLYLIGQGYCRAYNIQDGLEVNLNFYFEFETVTNLNSYIFNIPSNFTVLACEPMLVYRIDKTNLLAAIQRSPEIDLAGKKNLQLIAAKQERQLQLYRILTAKGRYEFLESTDPALLQRVPISQLASYLGIKRETLSRIRNKRRNPSTL